MRHWPVDKPEAKYGEGLKYPSIGPYGTRRRLSQKFHLLQVDVQKVIQKSTDVWYRNLSSLGGDLSRPEKDGDKFAHKHDRTKFLWMEQAASCKLEHLPWTQASRV